MPTRRRFVFLVFVLSSLLVLSGSVALAWDPVPVTQDPLVRMPGTQPGQVSLEDPNRCLNCHSGYNREVEPGFNWQGSMMAQSARDFLYWSCLTVAAQDSIWAVGTPNAVDICERCHFPKGWLEGRSDPPNASAMTGADFDGVQCDFCHRMVDPFFETTHSGAREGADWSGYWDESGLSSTPSGPAADATYAEDMTLAQAIQIFNGGSFFSGNLPPAAYTENGSGQYFVSPNSAKRASFADAAARHQMFYSRYHKSKYFCATCHDVSNPVLANLGQDGSQPLTTESASAYSYFHVERTFSEFMLSDYGRQGGAATNADFQAQGAPGITQAAKCQDCHMRDVRGMAANKNGAVLRPDGSVEHPQSGQPLHDMTGGNAWVSWVLASAVSGSANFDAVNAQLLNQGPAVLTLDLTQGQGIDPVALLAGVDRAKQQLGLAATITDLSYNGGSGELTFRVQNNSGHKLISGFPEGRRMFVNVKAYAGGALIHEVNPYDFAAGTLKGLSGYVYQDPDGALPAPAGLGVQEAYRDDLVYEMHPTSALTGETETFHFALATGRYKDNRIPPKGFRIGEAADRHAVPVWHGTEDPSYFTAQEYAGGYDQVILQIPAGADRVEVGLYYQTTSREYIEFLRDEIRGTGSTLVGSGAGGDPAYLIQDDPFFAGLKAWGNTLWTLWTHNMNVDGARPFLMAQAVVGAPTQSCTVAAPTLTSATPGHQEVTLTWTGSDDPSVAGYRLYYDQNGKAQPTGETGATSYVDAGLTNGQEYCYKVTALVDATCESPFSNILCAIPNNQGQARAGVATLETGRYETQGKGPDRVTLFVSTSSFIAGDGVVLRARVVDQGSGLGIPNATVNLAVTGPESLQLTTGPSDANGLAEVTWNTAAPNKRGQGGTTPGSYSAAVTGVTAAGYTWDGAQTPAAFTIQAK